MVRYFRLFEKGSWLNKPVKTVMDQLHLLKDKETLSVLDLGSGVGRNSIPNAQSIKIGKVVSDDEKSFSNVRRLNVTLADVVETIIFSYLFFIYHIFDIMASVVTN